MNNFRFLHLLVGLAALFCGLYASTPLSNSTSPTDLAAALAATLLGLVNIQQFSIAAGKRAGLAFIGSLLILIAALLTLAVLFIPAAAAWQPWAIGTGIAGVCLTAALSLTAMLPAPRRRSTASEGPRESGTVKWFNTSKGFGFISRDQGEDVFVHFRAIRGEGHRVLEEGQRVEFVVARREKGLQAEDVQPLD